MPAVEARAQGVEADGLDLALEARVVRVVDRQDVKLGLVHSLALLRAVVVPAGHVVQPHFWTAGDGVDDDGLLLLVVTGHHPEALVAQHPTEVDAEDARLNVVTHHRRHALLGKDEGVAQHMTQDNAGVGVALGALPGFGSEVAADLDVGLLLNTGADEVQHDNRGRELALAALVDRDVEPVWSADTHGVLAVLVGQDELAPPCRLGRVGNEHRLELEEISKRRC